MRLSIIRLFSFITVRLLCLAAIRLFAVKLPHRTRLQFRGTVNLAPRTSHTEQDARYKGPNPLSLLKADAQKFMVGGRKRPTTDLYLRVESDRSNLPRCSASDKLGIHSESHGSETCPPSLRHGLPERIPALFAISAISPRKRYSISWC